MNGIVLTIFGVFLRFSFILQPMLY